MGGRIEDGVVDDVSCKNSSLLATEFMASHKAFMNVLRRSSSYVVKSRRSKVIYESNLGTLGVHSTYSKCFERVEKIYE